MSKFEDDEYAEMLLDEEYHEYMRSRAEDIQRQKETGDTFMSEMRRVSDSYPRDENQRSAHAMVRQYEAGVCSEYGEAIP